MKELHLTAAGLVEDILIPIAPIRLRVNVNLTTVSKINDEMFHSAERFTPAQFPSKDLPIIVFSIRPPS